MSSFIYQTWLLYQTKSKAVRATGNTKVMLDCELVACVGEGQKNTNTHLKCNIVPAVNSPHSAESECVRACVFLSQRVNPWRLSCILVL